MYLYINSKGIPSYENKAPEMTITADSTMVAEGTRMANIMCASCHMGKDGKLSGSYMSDVTDFGKIYAPNITKHESSKLTGYTDGELVYLFRTGIKKNGDFSPPWMPKFPHLSDYDIACIIGFLRTDSDLLEPSDVVQPAVQPNFLAKALSNFVFKPLPYPTEVIPRPDTNDLVAFGKYVSTAKFDCYGCHSASFEQMDLMVPENSKGFFGGGNKFINKAGEHVLSPNLTMHEGNGLANWTKEDFVKTLKYGIRPNKPATQYPMPVYNLMTDREAEAVWAYLESIPIIDNPDLNQ
jgi:mono/diheme cytochrome c family protein